MTVNLQADLYASHYSYDRFQRKTEYNIFEAYILTYLNPVVE